MNAVCSLSLLLQLIRNEALALDSARAVLQILRSPAAEQERKKSLKQDLTRNSKQNGEAVEAIAASQIPAFEVKLGSRYNCFLLRIENFAPFRMPET